MRDQTVLIYRIFGTLRFHLVSISPSQYPFCLCGHVSELFNDLISK